MNRNTHFEVDTLVFYFSTQLVSTANRTNESHRQVS